MPAWAAKSPIRPWSASLLLAAALLNAACARRHPAHERMTWFETGPGSVRLVFESAPSQHVWIADAPDFVAELRRHGKAVVPADFEVVCDWHGKVAWFTILTVDGIAIPPQANGGAGREGNHLELGPFAGACAN